MIKQITNTYRNHFSRSHENRSLLKTETNNCAENWLFLQIKSVGVFNKTIIPPALVGYEMVIANKARSAAYHLISIRTREIVNNFWLTEIIAQGRISIKKSFVKNHRCGNLKRKVFSLVYVCTDEGSPLFYVWLNLKVTTFNSILIILIFLTRQQKHTH